MATKKVAAKPEPKSEPEPKRERKAKVLASGPVEQGALIRFTAPARDGDITYTITTAQGESSGRATVTADEVIASKVVEVPGTIKVEFFADGKSFATGEFE